LREKKFEAIFDDGIFGIYFTLACQNSTSGSKLKKSLGEARAKIHGIQIENRRKESDDGFLA
jgi:hypothetical protein